MEPDIKALSLRPTEPCVEPSPSFLADPRTHMHNPAQDYEGASSSNHLKLMSKIKVVNTRMFARWRFGVSTPTQYALGFSRFL